MAAEPLGQTTFALGVGAIGALVGAGIAYGLLKSRVEHALRWAEKNEVEIRRVDTRCNSVEINLARIRGRTEGAPSRRFKAEDTQKWES